jgi:hypothetical protein
MEHMDNVRRKTPYNMRLAQWGMTSKIEGSIFYSAFVQVDHSMLISPPLRQAQNR